MNAEAVLLVDDGQAQGSKLDRGLEERVGTDDDQRVAAGNGFQPRLALLCRKTAGDQPHVDPKSRKPIRETFVVLLR